MLRLKKVNIKKKKREFGNVKHKHVKWNKLPLFRSLVFRFCGLTFQSNLSQNFFSNGFPDGMQNTKKEIDTDAMYFQNHTSGGNKESHINQIVSIVTTTQFISHFFVRIIFHVLFLSFSENIDLCFSWLNLIDETITNSFKETEPESEKL